MFLICFLYYISFVFQSRSASNTGEKTHCYYTDEERKTIKYVFCCYIEAYIENKIAEKEEIYQQLLKTFETTSYKPIYNFFETKNIPLPEDMITNVLLEINKGITEEINELLKNHKTKNCYLYSYIRKKGGYKKLCLSYLKKDELKKLLSVQFFTFYEKESNKLYYINKTKEQLKKSKNEFCKIFNRSAFEAGLRVQKPNYVFDIYDRRVFDLSIILFENIAQSLCVTESEKLVELGFFENERFYIINPEIIVDAFELMISYMDNNLTMFYEEFIRYLDDKKKD